MIFESNNLFIELISQNLPYMLLLMIAIVGIVSILFFITQLSAGQIAKINYKNLPLTKILYLFFGGVLAGVIYGIFDISLKIFIDYNLNYLNGENIIIFQLFIIIPFSMMSSFFVSILSMIVLLGTSISNLLNNENWYSPNSSSNGVNHLLIFLIVSYTVVIISITLYRLYIFLTKKEEDKKKNILFSVVISSLVLIIYLISFNVILADAIYLFIFNYLLSICLFIFFIVIFKNINKIINDTFFLKRSIVYDDDIFVREEFSNEIFLKFINTNKVSTGLFFKIIFNGTEEISEKYGASVREKMELDIINEFFKMLNSKKIFLKNGYNEKLFFIPLSIEVGVDKKTIFNNDKLIFIDTIIKTLSKTYNVNDKKFKISLDVVGTLYGFDSCELMSLNKNIEKINLENFNHNKNKSIYLYNEKNNSEKEEWENYQRIKREGNIDQIETKFIKINNNEYISPVYKNNDEWEIRNINYISLEKYYDEWNKKTEAKILLKITNTNISSLKNAENFVKKIIENDFNLVPIYFYSEKNIKINRNIKNLFKNNNIFIL